MAGALRQTLIMGAKVRLSVRMPYGLTHAGHLTLALYWAAWWSFWRSGRALLGVWAVGRPGVFGRPALVRRYFWGRADLRGLAGPAGGPGRAANRRRKRPLPGARRGRQRGGAEGQAATPMGGIPLRARPLGVARIHNRLWEIMRSQVTFAAPGAF